MNTSQLEQIAIEGIDKRDYPQFSDAYISYAEINGVELTDEQYTELVESHGDFVHQKVFEKALGI